MIFPITVCLVFAIALCAPRLHRLFGDATGKVLALLPLGLFIYYLSLVSTIAKDEAILVGSSWIPSLGIDFTFRIDGLSLLFLLIISGVGTFISLFAGSYLHGDRNRGRFYAYFIAFMGAMLGVVSSDNLILMFIFWELTSITSYLLIGYYNENEESRRSALQALVVTGGGGLALLAGFIVLGNVAGTFSITEIIATHGDGILDSPLYPVLLTLILLGAFTKSAQVPFHFWLPNAMAAPAPVSAFLHSATMVKAGIFLMARLHPALDDHLLWQWTVAPIGALTFLTGVVLGLGQTDLKKVLAYTTLSVLGILTMLLGLASDYAVKAAMTYLLAHAMYKAALFMAAGTVDHETGSRDIRVLSGLRKAMPLTAIGAMVGGLSMAGVPFLFGFIGKEYFYKATLRADQPLIFWETVAVVGSMPMVALGLIAGLRPFLGKPCETPKHAHEAPWEMWIGPIILGLLSLTLGIFPGFAANHLMGPATNAVLGHDTFTTKLELWSGFTTAFVLSLITFLGGFVVFKMAGKIRAVGSRIAGVAAFGPEAGYFAFLRGLIATAKASSHTLQYGYLRYYLLIIMSFVFTLFLLRSPLEFMQIDAITLHPVRFVDATICFALVIGAVTACITSTRLVAIAALGVTGIGVSLIFALYSAPDLAITQFLVETLSVVMLLFAFEKLPLLRDLNSRTSKIRDSVVSLIFGAIMTSLILMAMSYQMAPSISPYFLENSYLMAQGKNIVNVILVDFRALDTLGEIIVLAVAAIAVIGLLRLRLSPSAKDSSK